MGRAPAKRRAYARDPGSHVCMIEDEIEATQSTAADGAPREVDLDPDRVPEATPEMSISVPPGATLVEIIGVGLRVRGYMRAMHGGRFSDQVNLSIASLHLYEAALVDRSGHTHAILSEDLFITKRQIILISELRTQEVIRADYLIPKTPREFVAVAPGFVITGQVHLSEHATADLYFESEDPPFIPFTAVEIRGRLGEAFRARYDFALLNRSQVSAMGLRPMGSTAGRRGQRWDTRLDDPDH